MRIANLVGREILDSRGNPTIEVDVLLTNGLMGRASVPSGASTGRFEACELRDEDKHRFAGRGVLHAIAHVEGEIRSALQGVSVEDQSALDALLCELDGTDNKSRLGANALLAVSVAAARAHANALGEPLFAVLNQGEAMSLPVPMMNVLNGGLHADNTLDIQEFMIMPVGARDFPHAIQIGAEVFHVLKTVLRERGLSTAVGDEGGFAPNLSSNQQALDLLVEAVDAAGFVLGQDVVFALDVAASSLYAEGGYHLRSEGRVLSSAELIDYYDKLLALYPIVSIEDGLDEEDWSGWVDMTAVLGQRVQLVGDDLFVTHSRRLAQGIESSAANAVLIKPNQIGTLSEARETMRIAVKHHYHCVMSHRSGETEDTLIADLAVATGCGQIKTGSLCRTDRVAKYNQLLRIHQATAMPYAGRGALARG
jgi:enolase